MALSNFAKGLLLVGGAGAGALVLLKRSSSSPAAAPLPASSMARPQPPAPAGTPQLQQVAGDVQAVVSAATAVKGFFDSLPSWSSNDGTPALGADAGDPFANFTP